MQAAPLAASPDKARLIEALEALADVQLEGEAAIMLQNDLWGLHERARSELSDPELQRIVELSAELAHHVAPESVDPPPDALPPVVAELDVVEQGTEMPILSHESSFGFRRVFRVAMSVDGSRRVLFSQLVAFDREGRIGVSSIVGEVEHLVFRDGALVEARVWHREAGGELQELDAVGHIPALGADSFFLQEPSPIALDTLPCSRCHEDDALHSLPRADLPARPRWQRVLDQLNVPSVRQ